jgi:tetratricopeptide (TPR) repeat protein
MARWFLFYLSTLLGLMSPLCLAQVKQPENSNQAIEAPQEVREIERALREGRFSEAQTKARSWLASRPKDELVWTYLGVASARLGQLPQAIEAFEKAVALAPEDPQPLINLGFLYAATNQLDKAITYYQKALALDGRNVSAYYYYGKLLMAKERLEEAREALRHAVQISPKEAEVRIALVEALLRSRHTDEARLEVQALLEAETTPTPALVSLGVLLIKSRELGQAQEVLSRALAKDPNRPAVHLALSKLYIASRDYTKAIGSARQAVSLAPKSLESHLALADALIAGKQSEKALDHLLNVQLQFQDSAVFQYTLGIAQFGAHRYQQAIACFKKAVRRDPKLDVAYFLLGNASLFVGDLEQAETSLKTAIALNPKNVLYYNFLVRVYEQKGAEFKTAAAEATRQALVLDPKDIESRERLVRWAKIEGDLPQVRSLLEEVIRDSPSDISARELLASVYYRLNLRQEGDEQQAAAKKLEAEKRGDLPREQHEQNSDRR